MDKVSVIIPCYNQSHFLPETVESVLAQTHPAYEIIAVDDESPDRSAEVIGRYAGVRYLRQQHGGVCVARNYGIAQASGDYLVFVDGDDRLLPHHLETCVAAFRAHPESAFVCGDYRWFGMPDTWHVHNCAPLPTHYMTLLRFNFIGPPCVAMFRRDSVQRVGGFQPGLEGTEDQDLYFQIIRTHAMHCHHTVIAEYRRHATQESQNWGKMLTAAMKTLQRQRPFVQDNRVSKDAYRHGITFRRRLYGELLLRQGLKAVKSKQWKQAVTSFGILGRYYPSITVKPAYHKVLQLLPHTVKLGAADRSKAALSEKTPSDCI